MVKNSRERIASSTPTLQKEGGVESEKIPVLKYLSGNSRLNIWPEWDDASLANEKWDVPQKGKSDRAARTPGTLFEDPEGLVILPSSLKIETWRRPSDYLGDKAQTVVEDPDQLGRLNILLPNQAIFKESELIRAIITQISLLYQTETPSPPGLRTEGNGSSDVWKPWHHLYPRSKPPNSFPVHSASGKYAVKLFWMGCWRKIIVDDQIPFNADGRSLLPQCESESELWLPILSKAIIKVASLDFKSGYPAREISEVSVIQMLTGWMPEVIDVKSRGDEDIWNMINSSIPAWTEEQLPLDSTSVQSPAQSVTSNVAAANPTIKEPSFIFGSYDIAFDGDEPIGVPEIKAEVGGTSFSGLPPPMIWLTETRNSAIPPPKPPPFLVASDPAAPLRPTEALFQLRQQRQQRIKHELLLKELAATSPKLIHATSAFPNFEEVLGDYVPDTSACQARGTARKKEPEKKDQKKKPENVKGKKEVEKEKGEKKKEDKKKSTDDKSEKAEKKKDKKKTPDNSQQELPPESDTPEKEEQAEEEEEVAPVSPLISFWIEFNQFFSSFTKLYVFHKPSSYSCHRSVSDMRDISPSSMIVPTGGRRTAAGQSGAASSASHLRGIPAPSPIPVSGNIPQHNHSHLQGQPGETQPPLIICIDSTVTMEMLISFTSLSYWHDAPIILNPSLGPVFTPGNKLGFSASEVVEHNSNPENEHTIVVPGRLELSTYIWSDITASANVLKTVETTATKTCRITLPAGLHTLRLTVAAPYAWHADFVSNTPFVIADTESFVNHVNKESLRYQASALRLVQIVAESVESFGDPDAIARTIEEIACADKDRDKDKIFPDIKVFFEALFHMLDAAIGDQLTDHQREAWSALSTTIIRSYRKGMGDSLLGIFENDPVPFKKHVDPSDETFDGDSVPQDNAFGENELGAAKKIQKHFRGHHVRKRTRVLLKGTKVNMSTKALLQESWGKLEGDELQHGLAVLNKMFAQSPGLMDQYSFKEDRVKSAYYIDYHGTHGDVPARNWFLVFKEVFTAPREALISVSVTAGLSGLLLRIIDNDSGKEIPTVCNRPKPYVFTPNKAGYTIMCEGKTVEGPLASGKYRLRLVGNTPDLLVPTRDIAVSGVEANEVKEYYTPERNNIMFRYAVNVTCDTPSTVQVSTSKSDVNIRVEIFDGEDTLFKREGIGHIVVPCVTFYSDDQESSAKGRRTPLKSRRSLGAKSGTKSPATRTKVSPIVQEPDPNPRKKGHHYIVQATVLRNTWQNNDSPWLSIIEKIQPKESEAERPLSGSITEEKPSTPNRKRGAKEEKSDPKKAAKPGGKAPSPAFDESKPYWILRVCADSGEEVILKRDTQREDEIKSIKAAWEELQPGRAAKAKALREKYLARKAEEKPKADAEDTAAADLTKPTPSVEEAPTSVPSQRDGLTSSLSDVRPDTPKYYEIPPAFKPYVKDTARTDEVYLFDDDEHARLLEQHKDKVEGFHDDRRSVLTGRKDDRARRNDMKEQLLLTAENMQVEVDTSREDVLALRDTLRQKQLAEEAARIAALEPEQLTTPSPKPPSAKKPKSPKGGKKKK